MREKTKNEHYVPKCYLLRWKNEKGKVWAYDKTQKKYWPSSIDDIACKRYFYDIDYQELSNQKIELLRKLGIEPTQDEQFIEHFFSDHIEGIYSELDSVQSLKQVTAPSDEFVISRLDTIESIIAIEAVTEEHDPNGMLNAPGGYIGCIYFYDSHVNQDNLQAFNAGDVIDIGTVGGGCIEVYSSSNDAENREVILASYDDTIYPTGSHR